MNRTAKVVQQSVMAAILVIVSVFIGVQFGANFAKDQVVGQTLEKNRLTPILVDNPLPCPNC